MSLADELKGLISGDEATAVDLGMKLLDPKAALMHTEIVDPKTMNQLRLMIAVTKDEEEKAMWKQVYRARALHMVAYKRKRVTEIVKIFTGLQAFLAMNANIEKKGGLLGKR